MSAPTTVGGLCRRPDFATVAAPARGCLALPVSDALARRRRRPPHPRATVMTTKTIAAAKRGSCVCERGKGAKVGRGTGARVWAGVWGQGGAACCRHPPFPSAPRLYSFPVYPRGPVPCAARRRGAGGEGPPGWAGCGAAPPRGHLRLPAGGSPPAATLLALPEPEEGRGRRQLCVLPPAVYLRTDRVGGGGGVVALGGQARTSVGCFPCSPPPPHIVAFGPGVSSLSPPLPSIPPPPPSPPTAYSPAAVATRCSTPLPSRESGRGRCCCIPWSRRGWLERCGSGGGERPSSAAPS